MASYCTNRRVYIRTKKWGTKNPHSQMPHKELPVFTDLGKCVLSKGKEIRQKKSVYNLLKRRQKMRI